MQSRATIFNIQHFSISDGPGIRTTVFFKGCPLRCKWCHNPESWEKEREVGYMPSKCIECGQCGRVCKNGCHVFENGKHVFERKSCVKCGICILECVGALEWIGYQTSCEEVIKEIKKDAAFYENSGGGVTLSGGEPLMQAEFCMELLIACKKEGFSTCVETSGYVDKDTLLKLMPYVDIFLYDYKETDCMRHKLFTGVDNTIILENIRLIDRLGAKIILRCPIIPQYNFNAGHIEGIIALACDLQNLLEINIEPYHPLGIAKADMVGKQYCARKAYIPDAEEIAKLVGDIQRSVPIPVRTI